MIRGLGLATLGAAGVVGVGVRRAFGASRRRIAAVATGSPQYRDGAFHNAEPSRTLVGADAPDVIRALLTDRELRRPVVPVPLQRPDFPTGAGDLAITWLGHASALIEVDGYRVLADPVFGERVSPSGLAGPRRLFPSPVSAQELPPLDAILISHDHYDHLDLPTVKRLITGQRCPFVVPIGVGAHLRSWGVPAGRVIELDWHGTHRIGDLELVCTPARHFSGRGFRRDLTLWSSWAVRGPVHRVFFGGDTGYSTVFADIGHRYGPFDVTLLPIGAYSPSWPDIHLDPEQAWQVHQDVRGRLFVPIHWATFDLAPHPWAEPVTRLLAAAGPAAPVVVPRPGQRFDPRRPPSEQWWLRPGEPAPAPLPQLT